MWYDIMFLKDINQNLILVSGSVECFSSLPMLKGREAKVLGEGA